MRKFIDTAAAILIVSTFVLANALILVSFN